VCPHFKKPADIETLIAALRARGLLQTGFIEDAFRKSERGMFLPPELQASAYADEAVVTASGKDSKPVSSCSQPSTVCEMLNHLELRPSLSVLEVGTGTGWNAALIARIVGDPALVHTVDCRQEIVATAKSNLARAGLNAVSVVLADGKMGLASAAPFDRIVVTAGSPEIFPAWIDQLKDGGILLFPCQIQGLNTPFLKFRKNGSAFTGRFVGHSEFMPLSGCSKYYEALIQQTSPRLAALMAGPSSKRPGLWAASDSWEDWRLRSGFMFFLTLVNPAAVAVYMGGSNWENWVGLWRRPDNLALMGKDEVSVFGDGAAYEGLLDCAAQWTSRDCPVIGNYEVTVADATAPEAMVLRKTTPLLCRLDQG
jgi:protein-L-isoaspartate(D-aspartate) O-methyltransferase